MVLRVLLDSRTKQNCPSIRFISLSKCACSNLGIYFASVASKNKNKWSFKDFFDYPLTRITVPVTIRMSNKIITGELSHKSTQTRAHNLFEWEIPEFSNCFACYWLYETPPFTFMNVSSYLLMIVPKSFNGFLVVSIINENDYPTDVNVKFSIKKCDGTLIKVGAGVFKSKGQHFVFFRSHVYNKSKLLRQKLQVLPQDTLTIVCDFEFDLDWKQKLLTAAEASTLKEAAKHMKLTETDVLSKNFKNLLGNKDSCDAVLLVQGKEFKVHKSILIARSSVFAAMFQHDTAEKETGKVVIPDCDPHSFKKFLEYVYCGRLEDISSDSAFHLYYTSDKYNMQELKAFCTKYLSHNLTIQNVCEVVAFAGIYDEMGLLSAAQDFFNKNLEEILKTVEWKDLLKNNFCLANKLLIEMSKVKK